MKTAVKYLLLCLPLLTGAARASAQTQVSSVTLGPEQVATIKTTLNNSTRIAFPDTVGEIVCGDLYDAESGKGSFVIQRSGTADKPGRDVYVKPIAQKGMTNMFVTTASGKTYNFSLIVVPANQYHMVISVLDPKSSAPSPENPAPTAGNANTTPCITEADLEKRKAQIEQAGQLKADDIIRKARDEAHRIINDAETRVAAINRKASDNAPQESERRFLQAILGGVQRLKVDGTRASIGKVSVTLDPDIYFFDGKAYLRYMIHNTSDKDFVYSAIMIEAGAPRALQSIPVELTQSKAENTLAPTETLSGVIAFDAKLIAPKDKIVFLIRGEESIELVRLNIQ